MAHKKGGGSTRNGRESRSQRLGVKRFGGETVSALIGPLTALDVPLISAGSGVKRPKYNRNETGGSVGLAANASPISK